MKRMAEGTIFAVCLCIVALALVVLGVAVGEATAGYGLRHLEMFTTDGGTKIEVYEELANSETDYRLVVDGEPAFLDDAEAGRLSTAFGGGHCSLDESAELVVRCRCPGGVVRSAVVSEGDDIQEVVCGEE